MTTASPTESRVFTVAQANAALPLVGSIVRDIVELSRSMMNRRELLSEIQRQRGDDGRDIYNDELKDIENCLKGDAEQLKFYVDELTDLGVQVRSLADGVVGFPSLRDGRKIFLSWQHDEPAVSHWHDLDEGYEQRRPVEPMPKNRIADRPVLGSNGTP